MTGKISPRAPLKDTLLIPAGGYAVVYFKTDNPGWWFLHCHIEVHQLEGMGLIINEGGFKTPPPGGMYKCGDFLQTPDEFNAAIAVTASPTMTTAPTPNTCMDKNDFGYQKRHEICKWYSVGLGVSVFVLGVLLIIVVLSFIGCYACGVITVHCKRGDEA